MDDLLFSLLPLVKKDCLPFLLLLLLLSLSLSGKGMRGPLKAHVGIMGTESTNAMYSETYNKEGN